MLTPIHKQNGFYLQYLIENLDATKELIRDKSNINFRYQNNLKYIISPRYDMLPVSYSSSLHAR
jgi:hypothetical protein